jgi:hypothetical protein
MARTGRRRVDPELRRRLLGYSARRRAVYEAALAATGRSLAVEVSASGVPAVALSHDRKVDLRYLRVGVPAAEGGVPATAPPWRRTSEQALRRRRVPVGDLDPSDLGTALRGAVTALGLVAAPVALPGTHVAPSTQHALPLRSRATASRPGQPKGVS